MRLYTTVIGAALAASFGTPEAADAQILKKIGQRVKQAAERETMNEVDRRTTEITRCALTDRECIRKAEREGKKVDTVSAAGAAAGVAAGAAGAAGGGASSTAAPGEGAWANYDFVPGERVLFAEDFTADNVGDFPRRLQFISGNLEIVTWQGARFLRATSDARFAIDLPEALPERFTVEFDVHWVTPVTWPYVYLMTQAPAGGYKSIRAAAGGVPSYPHAYVQLSGTSGVRSETGGEALTESRQLGREVVPVRVTADGAYMKVYLGEQRIANVPNAAIKRSNQLAIVVAWAVPQQPVLIGNIRIAAGGRELYDALSADGRVATQGILFDTGSDRIRPESTPTLKEIGEMLQQHSDLRLRIEGHTDNVGTADANEALSGLRAAAVRKHLITAYGIDADRLEAAGMGQTQPVAANDTPEGRQSNRRVELVRR